MKRRIAVAVGLLLSVSIPLRAGSIDALDLYNSQGEYATIDLPASWASTGPETVFQVPTFFTPPPNIPMHMDVSVVAGGVFLNCPPWEDLYCGISPLGTFAFDSTSGPILSTKDGITSFNLGTYTSDSLIPIIGTEFMDLKITADPVSTPEPGTMAMLVLGLILMSIFAVYFRLRRGLCNRVADQSSV